MHPEYFYSAMSEEELRIVRSIPFDIYPTGSQLFCPGGEISDFDLFGKCNSEHYERLKKDGFISGGSAEGVSDEFDSLRKKRVNLICLYKTMDFQRFKKATEVCLAIGGPEIKEQRIKVFNAIVDNKFLLPPNFRIKGKR